MTTSIGDKLNLFPARDEFAASTTPPVPIKNHCQSQTMKLFSLHHRKDFGQELQLRILSFRKFALALITVDCSDGFMDCPGLGVSFRLGNNEPLVNAWIYIGSFSLWLELLHFSIRPWPEEKP
jgi:hypothetical protein